MKTLAINSDNDIFLDNSGNLAIAVDLKAMANIYTNKSQANLGELPYNTDKGIDFFNTIFSSPCYPDLFQNEVLTQLEDTEKTLEILNYTDEIKDDVYSYSVEILTEYGVIELNG